MDRRNVELKAPDRDPARTLALALEAGAVQTGTLTQTDTYFWVAEGRLKLREQDGEQPVLIPYVRADNVSKYGLVPAAPGLKEALGDTLGVRVVVAKTRRLLMWEGTVRIHLDEVAGLGSFLEIEAVAADPASDLARERDQFERLRRLLGVTETIDVSYSDLLLAPDPALATMAATTADRAYAPHSDFHVGAAVETTTGQRFAGANVENDAYPLGNCAEASALAAMVGGEGPHARLRAAVVTHMPCGGCRQRLRQFADPATPIHVLAHSTTYTMERLLPWSFSL